MDTWSEIHQKLPLKSTMNIMYHLSLYYVTIFKSSEALFEEQTKI